MEHGCGAASAFLGPVADVALRQETSGMMYLPAEAVVERDAEVELM